MTDSSLHTMHSTHCTRTIREHQDNLEHLLITVLEIANEGVCEDTGLLGCCCQKKLGEVSEIPTLTALLSVFLNGKKPRFLEKY